MSVNSKAGICNLALSHLGQKGTVSDIDTPTDDIERIFSLHYDSARGALLKMVMPNFALARKRSARVLSFVADETYGYAYAYQKPADMLKLLGIGNANDKQNNYVVEGDYIYTDELYEDGAYLRYIKNVEDVSKYSEEFKYLHGLHLATIVCMPVTQSLTKQQLVDSKLKEGMMMVNSLSAQENRPVLRSTSRFRQARISGFASEVIKK
jgi:hypothetical protein